MEFFLHFIFDLIDHEKFRVNGLKVTSGELEDDSVFGAGDDFGASFDVSDVEELFLDDFLDFLLELSSIRGLIPQPSVELKIKHKQPIVHIISGDCIKQKLMIKHKRQAIL